MIKGDNMKKIPARFWEDDAWVDEHYAELVKKNIHLNG